MMHLKKPLILSLFILAIIVTAFAHEYILLAYKFKVAKGDTLELHLFVADGFNIELERPLQKSITKSFELISHNGTADLLAAGKDETLPILNRVVDFDGLGLIHTEREYARITLGNKKFLAYLKEDHLENIRIKADPHKQQQRERYSRYIKCLVQSNPLQNDTLYKMRIGQNFEIILLSNPYRLKIGSTIKAQLFFKGKPLANKVVTARNRTGSEAAINQISRTDAAGVCSFVISRKGDWFLHTTHMIPCPDPIDADWESFWASYSFGIE